MLKGDNLADLPVLAPPSMSWKAPGMNVPAIVRRGRMK
jgi:hypothetical protein